jgi:hypothetical protein
MKNLLGVGGVACWTKISVPFAINSTGNIYQFSKGITFVLSMGKKYLVFTIKTIKIDEQFDKRAQCRNDAIELNCKAFIEDYMERVDR